MQAKIIKLVDVSYGGENGFNQAIELAAESLQNVKFIQEKKLIGKKLGILSVFQQMSISATHLIGEYLATSMDHCRYVFTIGI